MALTVYFPAKKVSRGGQEYADRGAPLIQVNDKYRYCQYSIIYCSNIWQLLLFYCGVSESGGKTGIYI